MDTNPATRATLLSGFVSTSDSHSVGTLRFDLAGNLLAGFGDGSEWRNVTSESLNTYDMTSLSGNSRMRSTRSRPGTTIAPSPST